MSHNAKKYANIESEPVLLFDNKSNNFHLQVELLTINEVAGWLKISASGVRRLQQGRQLPFIKVGGSIRFSKSDVTFYLEERRVKRID